MASSTPRPLVHALFGDRAKAPVRALCVGLLSLACSSGRFGSTPEVSHDGRTHAAHPKAPRLGSPAAESRIAGPEPQIGSAAKPLELALPRDATAVAATTAVSLSPALSPELCRLRDAAQRRVIGREEPVDRGALGCVEFENRSSPGRDAKPPEPAMSPMHWAPTALGTFVPIEQEPALGRFHRALGRLMIGDDDDGKVRILAYGASHTQADAYPGYLRAYLQSRFGDGGRGFVPLGRVNAWHGTLDTRVRHRVLTVHHARSDGVAEPLGLFGAALVGRHGDAFGEITTAAESPNTRFEVHYWTQPGGGDFGLYVDGRRLARIPTKGDKQAPGYYAFEATPGRHQIRVQLRGNGPVRLFGIVAETANPGLVVDTLGIGGSRMGGHLRWDEDGWIEAVRRRKPDLVTFAYGTNEAADKHLPIPAYEMQLRAVLSRLRKALPEVSCVLIAPFDLPATAHSRLMAILDAQRRISKEFGCGFWDAHRFMGGRGSIRRWASAKPPLASSDHIHLTRRGYAYAGVAMGDALMRVYDLNPAHFAGEAIVAAPPSLPPRDESSGSGLPSMRDR